MSKLTRRIVRFLDRHDGPTAVEYAIMLSVIVMVSVWAIRTFGSDAKPTSRKAGNAISSAR